MVEKTDHGMLYGQQIVSILGVAFGQQMDDWMTIIDTLQPSNLGCHANLDESCILSHAQVISWNRLQAWIDINHPFAKAPRSLRSILGLKEQ